MKPASRIAIAIKATAAAENLDDVEKLLGILKETQSKINAARAVPASTIEVDTVVLTERPAPSGTSVQRRRRGRKAETPAPGGEPAIN